MSGDLHSLIRLQRWKVEEKQRALADLRALGDSLRRELERLAAELKDEAEVAEQSVEAAYGYDRYLNEARRRRKRLEASISQVEEQIVQASEELAAAFEELKRIEQVQAERDRRERERQRRRETAQLDEIGLNLHCRGKQES